LNLFLGLIAWLFQVEFLQDIGIGFYSIIFGLVFLVLGFFVKRRSAVALILAIAIFALDALLGLLAGGASYATGLVVRVILIIPMVQGVGAIRALKQRETTQY
jgi:glucose dehydrogenase